MKTTKEIAELFAQEIERIAKGDVRKDVITGLEKCSNAIIKLARLEMDFACNDWKGKPAPWLLAQAQENQSPAIQSARKQALISEIIKCQEQMKNANPTLKQILSDKIKTLQGKLESVVALEMSDAA